MEEVKTCTSCFISKPFSEYYKKYASCKPCVRARVTAYGKVNKDRISEYNKTKRLDTPSYLNRPWQDKLKRYGVTQEQFQSLLDDQKGLCAICDKILEIGKHCHIDHDHQSNKIRGLLCSNCNLMLGHSKDSPIILRRAIDYLERR